ncbi:hypothetical protein F5144DRAFT_587025 [Chaetomium tenue]|uniref:Uncharacterized protein n=1 Tax=Chaetomium tenue TaxID=1854479 RepID=A0ACB7NY01_9PEZI|nr:hypothetical protein F5144DRAFT_587025 [Chaetomium globosum]
MDALFNASDEAVRAILIALCDDARVYSKALKYLALIEPKGNHLVSGKAEGGNPQSGPNSKKRKLVPTLSICIQCGQAFHEGTTDRCRYHDGELEPDYDGDFWADHDERCHGVIDTDSMREDFPDGFVWDCCNRLGSEPGCQKGYHESNPEKKCSQSGSEAEDTGESEDGGEEEGEDNEDDED